MKKIFLIISVSYFSLSSFGQGIERCATSAPLFDIFEGINLDSLNNIHKMSDFTYNVKVFVHVIRETDGTNGVRMFEETTANTTSGNYNTNDVIPSVHTELQNLAAYYSPHDICFTLVGWEYIDDSGFASASNWGGTLSQSNVLFNSLLSTYPEASTNVIDIYILPQDRYYRGKANGIPGSALVMYAGRFEWIHMAHEMGHCLSLAHTFETAWGVECPDGSNCATAGDRVCDTPADDDGGWSDSPCAYTAGNSVNCNGANRNYNPLTNNGMSYAPFSCRNSFTTGQKTRIAALLSGFGGVVNPAVNDDNLTLNWSTISSGYTFEAAINTIEAGYMFPSTSVGDYEINSSAKVTFTAGDEIILNPGFIADPGTNGYFNASINQICGN